LHSWAYWQFKYDHDITTVSGPEESFYNKDGSLQSAKVAALSRTYAPIVAGRPEQMKYSSSTGAFRLRYRVQSSTMGLATEVYLNKEMNYNKGNYLASAINAGILQDASTNILKLSARQTPDVEVDVAVTRLYTGAASGWFRSADHDLISWQVIHSPDSAGFEFHTTTNITWWKSLKIFTDAGEQACELRLQDKAHGPVNCDLSGNRAHDFLFEYRLEIWKAKAFGIHRHVDTIASSMFGPLHQKRVVFRWVDDSASASAEEVVV
jgi:hypothetical protein